MKILYISPRYSGGIGGHAARVAKKLKENGFEVKLLHVPHIPIKNLKNPSFVALSIIKSLFKHESYDVVHAFNVPSAFAMRLTKARKKVLSVHGQWSDQIDSLHSDVLSVVSRFTESHVLKWADKLTTDSKWIQRNYKEKYGLDFDCMYGPLDTNEFRDIPDVAKKDNQVVFIGRDSYEKGIDILKSVEPEINGKVVYCTNVSWKKAMSTLKASSLLVVPSRMESSPQVVKEAMYLNIPVVATKVGDIPELMKHNETGVIVPPNEPKKLVDSINQLIGDKEFAKKIGEAGHAYLMKNRTWEILLPKYIKFYDDLVNS